MPLYRQYGSNRYAALLRTQEVLQLLGLGSHTVGPLKAEDDPLTVEQVKHERRMWNHWIRQLDREEVEPKPEETA